MRPSAFAALAGALVLGAMGGGYLWSQHQGEADRLAAAQDAARANAASHPEMAPSAPVSAGLPFPVKIEAKFDLTDHFGRDVTETSYPGQAMAIFFGFANCQAICSVAMPRLGEAMEILGDDADKVVPLMITVDPEHDTVDSLGPALAKWHESIVGLTGSAEALEAARAAFQVEAEKVFEDPEGNPVYAHGSFIYLVGGGEVLTVMPPILSPERMAELIAGYVAGPKAL